MTRSSLVLGLAALFAGMTALLVVGAAVSGSPVALVVAIPLGVTSYVMYYHGSGKLARLVYRQHQARRYRESTGGRGGFDAGSERGGFGAGPRSRRRARTRAERDARSRFGDDRTRFEGSSGPRSGGARPGQPRGSTGPTRSEAREVLGVGVGADADEVRRAYREKVKDVHPDRGGDQDDFKRVTAAYDRLRERGGR